MSVSSDVHGSDYIVTRINTTVAVSIDVSFFFHFYQKYFKSRCTNTFSQCAECLYLQDSIYSEY